MRDDPHTMRPTDVHRARSKARQNRWYVGQSVRSIRSSIYAASRNRVETGISPGYQLLRRNPARSDLPRISSSPRSAGLPTYASLGHCALIEGHFPARKCSCFDLDREWHLDVQDISLPRCCDAPHPPPPSSCPRRASYERDMPLELASPVMYCTMMSMFGNARQ